MSEPVGSSEEKQFFAEVSKHGRASCKKCKQKCLQGELRIAKLVPSPSSVDKIKNWYHIDCIFETFLNQRQTTKRIENAHDIVGLDNLSAEHKSRILNKILECNEALELKASAKSARRQKSSKKATITVSVNNEDAISCSSSDISNSRESHEDNLFREFRIIIDKVGKKDSASEKTKVIRELFTKGSDGKGFKSDVYLWCKLLLPSIERRTVDLKTNLILKIFSQIFQKNLNDMLEHLKKSDLGQTIHYYFEHNKAVKPAKKSYLTMQEVDEFLEELLVLKREQKQIDLFKSLAKRCTANDLKVVVRWIRDDLRMSTETKQILDGVHPNAYKMFQSSNDLKSAIENCLNPPPTEITENVEDNDNKVTAKKRKTGSNSTNKSEAPVKRRNRRKLLEAPRKKKKKIDNIAKQEDFDAIFDRLKNSVTVPVKPIPNYFQGMKVLLENGVAECQAECVRYFIAYGGALLTSDQYEEATHVLHLRDTLRQPTTACPSSARHVIVKWIKDTVENDCLQDFRPYTVPTRREIPKITRAKSRNSRSRVLGVVGGRLNDRSPQGITSAVSLLRGLKMFALIPRSLIISLSSRSGQKAALLETVKLLKSDELVRREYHEVVGDILTPSQVMGIDHLRDPRLNKGLAFTLEERQALGIHGLQPARFKSQEEQLELCRMSIERYQEDLNKYLYLTELHDRNEKLFFRLLSENIESLMPIVYTPTVGLACQRFGLIYRRPRGLFITINDRGHCFDVLKNWPEPDVKAICVTDGERILGLGDLGACGMGIPVGKLALYTALAGIKPHQCLPIVLDVGTNNQNYLEDPLYVGLRQPRVTGPEYDSFVDEFMEGVVKRYGQNVLIQFEDFGNHNAFRYLDKYRGQYCTFNDDIQGTASVAVSGLLASKRITGKRISENKFLFLGAGEAAIGIADLCVKAMQAEGTSIKEARQKIWMVDIDGLLAVGRPEGRLEGHKAFYAKEHPAVKNFHEVVKEVKPSVMIGASAAGGAFTHDILTDMGKFNERPIIFALSNPTSKAECTAEQAYVATEGRCIFASGSPFGTVTYGDKSFTPGQGNNAYIFPGVALGVIVGGIHHIREELFLIAAQCVADNVTEADIAKGSLYPPLSVIKECSLQIAVKVLEYAYENGLASVYPEPKDKKAFVMKHQYNHNYEASLPKTWTWPPPQEIKTRAPEPTKLSA